MVRIRGIGWASLRGQCGDWPRLDAEGAEIMEGTKK
jgi:hypothetical protein